MLCGDKSLLNMTCCRLCPRECGADRASGNTGFCRVPSQLYAARAGLLRYEEPCLVGERGSGAVFFSGCNLGCIFCQNHAISGADAAIAGKAFTPSRLAEVFLSLQEQSAANINLVTPTHYLHQIIPALELAKASGLRIPVVYNTGAYEKPESLRLLDGLVDIYLPDLKYYSDALAQEYSRAPHYFESACAAIEEMVRQCPEPLFSDGRHVYEDSPEKCSCTQQSDSNPKGSCPPTITMVRGVIVRHLLLPGCLADSKKIVRYLYETYGDRIFLSIMNQYTPMPAVTKHSLLSRTVTEEEYDELIDFAVELGVENGFIQEGETASESFIPAFDGTGL